MLPKKSLPETSLHRRKFLGFPPRDLLNLSYEIAYEEECQNFANNESGRNKIFQF